MHSTWTTPANPWILRQPPRPSARLRLFCLPHAGGNAAAFRQWSSWAPGAIEICGVQYPGHAGRLREAAYQNFDDLLQALAAALLPELDGPFALFGHSLGALLAFELARWLRDRHGREPQGLFVSGHNAPQIPDHLGRVDDLDDAGLVAELRRLNCTPEAVLQCEELMHLLLPVIRADFAVCASYVYRPGEPLRCPLHVLAGSEDPRTDRRGLELWSEHTRGECVRHVFAGDHFFIGAQEGPVVQHIVGALRSA